MRWHIVCGVALDRLSVVESAEWNLLTEPTEKMPSQSIAQAFQNSCIVTDCVYAFSQIWEAKLENFRSQALLVRVSPLAYLIDDHLHLIIAFRLVKWP